jgi:hypothetical protein
MRSKQFKTLGEACHETNPSSTLRRLVIPPLDLSRNYQTYYIAFPAHSGDGRQITSANKWHRAFYALGCSSINHEVTIGTSGEIVTLTVAQTHRMLGQPG